MASPARHGEKRKAAAMEGDQPSTGHPKSCEESPSSAILSRYSGTTIIVNVGRSEGAKSWVNQSAEESFYVHKSMICADSKFFAAAASSLWQKDPTPKPIDLSDEEPSTFKMYVHFLYTKNVIYTTDKTSPYYAYVSLAKAYILGEKIVSHKFCNAVVRALIAFQVKSKKYPPKETIKIIYDGTGPSCPMRRLLVDYWVKISHQAWDTDDLIEKTSPEFVEDLAKGLINRRPTLRYYTACPQDPQDYYVYDVGRGSAEANQ